jgi:hypothetical protein
MPRRCSVCFHDESETINELLLAKTSKQLIAKRFSLSRHAVGRHSSEHLHVQMARAAEAAVETLPREPAQVRLKRAEKVLELARGCDLVEHLEQLRADARAIQRGAETAGDPRTALLAIRELVRIIEIHGRVTGQLASGSNTQVNVGVSFTADGTPQIPLEVFDAILDAGRERTGEEDLWGRFHSETSGFSAAAGDFEALWAWCRERREKATRGLLEGHAANDLPRDGGEGQG